MKKTLITVAVVSLVGASLTVIPASVTYADGLGKCADYEFVAMRGSGEGSSDPGSPNHYDPQYDGAGSTLRAAYTALNKQLGHMGYTSALDAVDYEAVALNNIERIEGVINTLGPYTESVGDGVEKLTQAIGDVQEQCPDSKIILGGYSQGAQVIDETLNMKTHGVYDTLTAEAYVKWENANYTPISSSTANSIAGILLYGDPKFNGSDTTVNSGTDDPAHSGVWLLHQKWNTQLRDAATKVVSDCHLADPVCNSRKDEVVLGTHHTIADAQWVAATQKALGDDPVGNALGLPHITYQQDAYQSVDQLLATMGLPVVSSRTLGVTADQPTDTAYLVDSRSDMWQTDPNNHDADMSASQDGSVTYMDEVAHAIDGQIQAQANRAEDERWMLAMYYAAPVEIPSSYKQPFTGYFPYPEFNTMAAQYAGGYVPAQIAQREQQPGGPAVSGVNGFYSDSSDYSVPNSLNYELFDAANCFAAAAGTNTYVYPRLGFATGALPGHRKRIVIVTDRPDDLTRSMQVSPAVGQPFETWSLASSISYLVQLGVSISFWNPIADPAGGAATSSFRSDRGVVAGIDGPTITTASSMRTETVDATDSSPSSTDIASETHGTTAHSADGLDDINAYAAQQPVDQISAPVASYTGQPVSATSVNTNGDGFDSVDHTDWTVTGPDGSIIASETTNGGGALQFTPSTTGEYNIRSTISLRSGFSGDATWTDTVSDAPTDVPDAPVASASVDDDNTVTVTWSPSPGATYYTVYDADGNVVERTNPMTDGNGQLAWSQSLSQQSGSVTYTVSASDDIGEGAQSAPAEATLPVEPPDTPTVVGSVDSENNVTLTWPGEANATSYTVYDDNHDVLDHLGTNLDADGNMTWSQALPNQAGRVRYSVSASNDGGESTPSAIVKVTLHNLHPLPANIPDATGSPSYTGDLDDQGVPVDNASATTAEIQSECGAGSPTEESGTAWGPFDTEEVNAVGPHSILINLTATNEQLCELYINGGLPSSEFENLQLTVDSNYYNYTSVGDLTADYPVPISSYLSAGAASAGPDSTRSFSVLMNFDSSFDASAQTTELQSEMDDQTENWNVYLGIGNTLSWVFRDAYGGGGGGATAE
jgi:hypothetical protein